jgi:hypothetical protein
MDGEMMIIVTKRGSEKREKVLCEADKTIHHVSIS